MNLTKTREYEKEMKFLLNTTTVIGMLSLVFILAYYASSSQWEKAICVICCMALFISCRWQEWRREEVEKTNNFIVGNLYGRMNVSPEDIENFVGNFHKENKKG
jgi:uncharacterized membrane protein